jgi:hypothetical protein
MKYYEGDYFEGMNRLKEEGDGGIDMFEVHYMCVKIA